VATVLKLVGTGAGGDILLTLGKRPLRTGRLVAALPQFSPRTVYRYASRLEEEGLIERREEARGPLTVVLSLSEAGRSLYRLLSSFESWGCMSLLGEMWELGLIAELSRGPRSLTQLSNSITEMSFHQVSRRVNLFVDAGLLARVPAGRLNHYELTALARRCMTMIAAIGRWRHRHPTTSGAPGLSIVEMTEVLRTALPLTRLPKHAGMSIALGVSSAMDNSGHRTTKILRGSVDNEGGIAVQETLEGEEDGLATATVNTWLAALLDGNRGRIRVRGNLYLVDSCLTHLYSELWGTTRSPQRSSTAVVVPGR